MHCVDLICPSTRCKVNKGIIWRLLLAEIHPKPIADHLCFSKCLLVINILVTVQYSIYFFFFLHFNASYTYGSIKYIIIDGCCNVSTILSIINHMFTYH